MLELIDLCRFSNFNYRFSQFKKLEILTQKAIANELREMNNELVEVVAFCLMPTHIHLLLKQIQDEGVTKFMSKLLNSYSKFFNIQHKRSGPLWASEFKNVLVRTDEQLLHLTRYIHLNPTSASIVDNPEDWEYSSYQEYLSPDAQGICCTEGLFNLKPKQYKDFVDDRKSYQKELAIIKRQLIDNYTG